MVFGQSGYKKNVVSFVDYVAASASSGMSDRQKEYISTALSRSVRLDRFSYAALPGHVVRNFSAEAASASNVSAERIRSIVERTLAPEFLSILDINKELLSKQNLSEADRNTFLATKAQSAGLSASQLESILNSGFFYVPYVEYYKRNISRGERDIKNDEGKVIRKQKFTTFEHELKVGLLWFRLSVDRSNTPSVSYIGTAKGWRNDPVSRSDDQDDGTDGNADWEAFTSAVNVSALNVGNETKKMDEFTLSGGITEVSSFGVNLNLGTREGVGLDDSYWVEEDVEDEAGNIGKERRGFIKIRRVGNNRADESAFSYAQTITGSNYSPGLSVKEIPMIGINALFGLGSLPVKIAPFDNRATKFALSNDDFAVAVTGETKNAIGPFFWFQGNMAPGTSISELWLHAGAAIGFLSVEGKFYLPKYTSSGAFAGTDSSNDIGASLSGYANIGLVKKFYFRRFGLVLQADLKYWMTNLSATGKDKNDNDLTYSLTQDAFGIDTKIGLEIYLTPMLSIGGGAEYNMFPTSNSWTAKVTDKDNNDTKNSDAVGPDTKYSGLGIYLWINYALPSLF
jgi:hypothetical protein